MKARRAILAAILAGCVAEPAAAQALPPVPASTAPLAPLPQCEQDRDALAKALLDLPEPPSRVLWASIGGASVLLVVLLVKSTP